MNERPASEENSRASRSPKGPMSGDPSLSDCLAKQEIADLLHRRARAADRFDLKLLLACHEPDSTDLHGFFNGKTEDFVAMLAAPASQGPTCLSKLHRLGNMLADVAGDKAFCETSHVAHESYSSAAGATDHTIVGRYLDELTCRSGRWLINSRTVVYDWARTLPATQKFWDLMGYTAHLRGSRDGTDPLYEHACVTSNALPPAPSFNGAPADASVSDADMREMLDRQAIAEVLYKRARGYDRRDFALILSCYHEDATERHVGTDGLARDFVTKVFAAPKKYPPRSTSHVMTNLAIDFASPQAAFAESYVTNYIARPSDTGEVDVMFGGRYLDKLERRDGLWAIAHCDVVSDWARIEPETAKFWDLYPGAPFVFGSRDERDPLYAHLGRHR